MPEKPLATIRINIHTRRDGTVYISSVDMPGLWLWGRDYGRVFGSIAPTIEELYRLNEGRTVKAREAPRFRFMREKTNTRYKIYPVAINQGARIL